MIPTWGAAFGANAIFNSAEFRADLTHSAVPDKAASGTTATFTRATTKTWQNNDGYLVTGLSGEIGFPGARRVRNLLTFTEDFSNAAWLKSSAGAGSVPVVTSDQEANPIAGVAYADKIVFAAPGAGDLSMLQQSFTGATGSAYVGSFYVKAFAAGDIGKVILFRHAAGGSYTQVTLTAAYQRVSIKETGIGAVTFDIGLRPTFSSSSGTVSVYLTAAQLEDVTAQTTQTAGEYVSVGVTSAPYYHGSMVDGVKCFPTDLAGNALPTSYTYDAVSLNGVAGTYVSTPDSVALDITIPDVRVKAQLADWSPSGVNYALIARRNGTDGDYVFRVLTSGALGLYWYTSGGVFTSVSSSAAVSASANETLWVRFTRSGTAVNFFQSPDGVTWTSVGTEQTAASASTSGSSLAMYIGQTQDGSDPLAGTIYRAQIYNGIDGTLAVDFDASRYAGGTTLTGSTGETWTLNGNAVIHPTNSPMLGYQAEGARTNLCLQSNAFTTAPWVALSTPTITQNAVGPNGQENYAWALTDNDAGNYGGVQQNSVAWSAGASGCYSILVEKKASSPSYPCLLMYYNRASNLYHYIIVNEVAGTVAIGGSTNPPAYGCVSFNDDFLLVWVAGTQAGATVSASLDLYPAVSVDGTTLSATKQGSTVFCDAQFESGATYPSSRIATTTVAVARNADVLTYSSAGNIDGTKGWCYAEASTQWSAATGVYNILVGIDTANRGPLLAIDNAPTAIYIADGTNAVQATGASTTFNSTSKRASTWGGSTMSVTGSGAAVASGAFDGNMNVGANIAVGILDNGGSAWFGTIRNVRIGQRQLSASEMQAITA